MISPPVIVWDHREDLSGPARKDTWDTALPYMKEKIDIWDISDINFRPGIRDELVLRYYFKSRISVWISLSYIKEVTGLDITKSSVPYIPPMRKLFAHIYHAGLLSTL